MTETWATVLDVQTEAVGEYLTADVAAGAVTLPVSDVQTFDERGGTLALNGESLVYTAVNLDASTLTLFSGPVAAALEGDRVELVPPQQVKRALVDLGKDEDEGIWAIVPQTLVTNLSDGQRTTGEAESVLIEERGVGELFVKDVAAAATDPAVLTLADLQNGHRCILKTAAESRTSTTTVTDDAELKAYLSPGRWRVELFAVTNGAEAGDVRTAWAFSGTLIGDGERMVLGPAVNSPDPADTNMRTTGFHLMTTPVGYGSTPAGSPAFREDLILDVAAAGVLTLQWAQNTSNATATVLAVGSRLYVTRMSI